MTVYRQSEASECGLVCLAIASDALGAKHDLAELRRRFPVSIRGLRLSDLVEVASCLGMTTRAVRCEVEELGQLRLPAILHWDLNHFVVLKRVSRRGFLISDPGKGEATLSAAELSPRFTGIALELERSPAFEKRASPSALKLQSLFRLTPEIMGPLAQTFVLSLLLQAYVIASPFHMKLAIDEAALKGDKGLLGVLALGFGLFALFNVGADALRGLALQRVGNLLQWDMSRRLFHHLLRLPLPWFQRRRLADVLARFESIEPVRQLIANGLVGAVIDGLLATVTLTMMFIFSWKLALVSTLMLGAYLGVRLAMTPLMVRLGADALSASIAEQGKRIETLRAIQTIKTMAAEPQRALDWSQRFSDVIRTNQETAKLGLLTRGLQTAAEALTSTVVIYLGAAAIIQNEMTVGALYAFVAYRTQFGARALTLMDQIVAWRMLDFHTARLSDIVLTPVESGVDQGPQTGAEIKGRFELENVSFRYAPHEAPVFQQVYLDVEPGEFVAIVGPSGSGKSTLLKILCGLYPASGGEVRIDGMPLASWGPRHVRKNLGVVMQDDELLSGSIAENVAFFDEEIDMPWVWECLRRAALDQEVLAMPMQIESFVGDMGSALSGGQKQRLLLARALYRRPKVLILDEATSHLDVQKEAIVNEALKELSITRIVVAHRPETIAAADRIVHLQRGTILNGRKLDAIKTGQARPREVEPA